MHFCNILTPHPEPSLRLCKIPLANETKFLGVVFDSKLTFKPHMGNLKKKYLQAMNLLCVVVHTGWGSDSTTLLRFSVLLLDRH
jgi:hypothetical protein